MFNLSTANTKNLPAQLELSQPRNNGKLLSEIPSHAWGDYAEPEPLKT